MASSTKPAPKDRRLAIVALGVLVFAALRFVPDAANDRCGWPAGFTVCPDRLDAGRNRWLLVVHELGVLTKPCYTESIPRCQEFSSFSSKFGGVGTPYGLNSVLSRNSGKSKISGFTDSMSDRSPTVGIE